MKTYEGYLWAAVAVAYFGVIGPALLSADSTFLVLLGFALGALLLHTAYRRFIPIIRRKLSEIDQ